MNRLFFEDKEHTPPERHEEETRPDVSPAASEPTPHEATRFLRQPAVDVNGMPLPRRVEEIDLEATQVTPLAFTSTFPGARERQGYFFGQGNWRGCLLRAFIGGLFVLVGLAILLTSLAIYQYYAIASTLPSVGDLRAHASQFETTRILDRNGQLLYEIFDPRAGRRTYVTLDQISPYVLAATIAAEDKEFYNHPGFDPFAVLRAVRDNLLTKGESGGGASTITQQLARTLLLSPEERSQRTVMRKIREIILAAEITRRYSKDEILELYLNEIYYGNLAYGIEAAATTYFGKRAAELSLGEAAFLAGLPQAPAVYDIYTNREATLQRMRTVVLLMYQLSQEKGCIPVSTSAQPVCVDPVIGTLAIQQIERYPFPPPVSAMRYPHWVHYVRSQLEARFDPQTIYRSGFTVYTTLDPQLQDLAQEIVAQQVAMLADKHVTNGALVAIRPSTGEILVMVGSADFYNEAISGQVNMATSPTRQPGSSIKPFTYLAALEKGWTPSTLLWDVYSEFPPSGRPDDPRPPYKPVNYDERYHGPVTVRSALANSYNIPAVKALQFVGIYDDPNTPQKDGMIEMARRLGVTSLTREDYGLSLTLGGGEVSLLEMTAAYAVIANGGRRMPPVAILKITDHEGKTVYEYHPPEGEQVLRPEHAYLISSILSDNEARAPMFGRNSVLNLPFRAAVKTGTSQYFTDNWTLGYTPDLAVGVWVGNADYTPMVNTTGLTGAAPIWSQFMQLVVPKLTNNNPTPFLRPAGVVDYVICAASGAQPSIWCPSQRSEVFAADQPPRPASQDLWQKVNIDTWTGLRASAVCGEEFTEEKLALAVDDVWGRRWIRETAEGQAWARQMGFDEDIFFAPDRECRSDDPRPTLAFIGLQDEQQVTTSPLDIYILAGASSGFQFYRLEYGLGQQPSHWETLVPETRIPAPVVTRAYTWDLSRVPADVVTLRLYMVGDYGYAERRLRLRLNLPTPTATPTPTPTITPSPFPTDTSLPPIPTETPSSTPSSTGLWRSIVSANVSLTLGETKTGLCGLARHCLRWECV